MLPAAKLATMPGVQLGRGIETVQPGGGRGGAERADDAGGVKAALLQGAARDRADPRIDFDGEHEGGERCAAGHAAGMAEIERHRPRARRAVDDARRMGVVEIESMDQRAVGQRGVAHRQARGLAEDDRRARAAGGARRRWRARRTDRPGGEADADGVEDTEACGGVPRPVPLPG